MLIWQMPGTIGLRNSSLVLLLVSALTLTWETRHQPVAQLPKPVLWSLLLLTAWIVAVILCWAAEPAHSWREFRGQWLVTLGCGLGAALVAMYASRSMQRMSQLVQIIFLALLAQVVVHDLMDVVYLALTGNQPIRQAPVLYLPTMITGMLQGEPIVKGFIGEFSDKFSYVNNLLAAFLVAETAQRCLLRKRWLPYDNVVIGLAAVAVLLCSYWLKMRNGNVGLLLLLLLGSLMIVARLFSAGVSKVKVALNAGMVLIVLAGVGWVMLASDSRWGKFMQTVPIAWDTQSNHAWITRGESDYPLYPNGEAMETTAYERIAWMKEGVLLLLENPWGTGYSRQSFGEGIDRKYDLKGLYRGGHAHSGVVDFSLANGVFGMVLWLAFLCSLLHTGWRAFRRGDVALGLTLMFLVSGFFTRSLVDSNMRDHVLQQFMFLAAIFCVLAGSRPTQDS